MIRLFRIAVPAALALGLAACGSSPAARYHTLAGAAPAAKGGGAEKLVEVLPVALPGRVDREALVLRDPDGRLDVSETDRWAGPLPEEIRAVLDDALWRTARAADVYAAPVPPAASDLPQYRLALRIERFDAAPGGNATVEASWTARQLPTGPAATCRAAFVAPLAGATPDAAAAGLADATRRLSAAVASSLAHLGGSAPCPAE